MSLYGTCEECDSIEIVLNVRQGEIVCTNCGLVKESRYLDDTYYGNQSFNNGEMDKCSPPTIETPLTRRTPRLLREVIGALIHVDSPYTIVNMATDLYHTAIDKLGGDKRGTRKRAIIAAAVHVVCQVYNCGLNPLHIYAACGVQPWLDYSVITTTWKSVTGFQKWMMAVQNNDSITRMVHSNTHIPHESTKDVIKIVVQLREKVELYLKCRTKASKFHATLIFIACGIFGCPLTPKDVQEAYGITPVTLNKHERLVQEALEAVDAVDAVEAVEAGKTSTL